MPDRPGMRGKDRPGTSLVVPKPKKPTPDNNMDVPEDDPWVTPKPTRRVLMQVDRRRDRDRAAIKRSINRKLTAKEWQTIARSMNDRRRPYAGVPVGRARVGGWRKLKPKPAFRPYAPHIPVRRPYAPRRFRPHGIHGGMRR